MDEPSSISDIWLKSLVDNGFRVRLIPIEKIVDLKIAYNDLLDKGIIDRNLYNLYLKKFRHIKPPGKLPDARSVIITAARQPMYKIIFNFLNSQTPVIIPPTYLYDTDKNIYTLSNDILKSAGFYIIEADLPLKLLAVLCGMACYGRNNITYIDGFGSFYRLRAYYTNLPCNISQWTETRLMSQCKNCNACQRGCPTGAISSKRFLIHAERCLTYLNEIPAEFPGWLNPFWHNCLIGCMNCQLTCPVNRKIRDWVVTLEQFTEDETNEILRYDGLRELSPTTKRKLRKINMLKEIRILPRNLRAILNKINMVK